MSAKRSGAWMWAALAALLVTGCGGEAGRRRPEEGEPVESPNQRAARERAAAGTGVLEITVTGFRSDEGQALINVFLDEDGFPSDPARAWRAIERRPVGGRVELTVEDVPAGTFAVSAFHDEDGDFELDQNFLGMPTERWGVSRDASGFLGPPAYEAAVLELAPGEHLTVEFPIG